MAEARRRTINGKPGWQAVRVITVKQVVSDPVSGATSIVKVKRRLTGSGSSKGEAEARLEEKVLDFRMLQRDNPNNPDLRPKKKQDRTSLNDLLDGWLAYKQTEGRKGSIDPSTLDLYQRNIDLHIRPVLGGRAVRSITRAELDRFVWEELVAKRKQVADPVSGKLVDTAEPLIGASVRRTIFSILNQTFDLGVKRELLDFNPIAGVERPSQQGMSDEAEADIIKNHYIPRRIVSGLWGKPELGRWILAFMGLRASERLGVELGSFQYLENPDKKTELTVNRQLDRDTVSGKFFVKYTTKTRSGKRILLLPDDVSKHLLLWKKQRDLWKKEGLKSGEWKPEEGLEDLFFVQPNGRAIRHTKDRYAWAKLLKDLKLPHHRLHDMRHMTATALGKQGVSPNAAKVILGHSDSLMTFYYQHLSKEDTAVPLAEVAEMFSKDVKRSEVVVVDDGTDDPTSVVDVAEDVGEALFGSVPK